LRIAVLVIAALAAASLSCHHAFPAAEACLPPDAAVVASFDLTSLRASPIYPDLPDTARQFLAAYPSASRLMLAWDRHTLLTVQTGNFEQPPSGATLVDSHLAISGGELAVRAAAARHNSHTEQPSRLVAYANRTVAAAPLWVAVQGGEALPLTGNIVNLNRLLRLLNYAAVSLTLDSPAQLKLNATAPTPEQAQQCEETLRAVFTLLAVGESRHPDLAALLQSAQIELQGRTLSATLQAPLAQVDQLLAMLAH
jgi:hypothetical protein